MTPDQAADLAARTLAAIKDRAWWDTAGRDRDQHQADGERVASDLAGLRDHFDWNALRVCGSPTHGPLMSGTDWPCPDAARYAAGLRRTASLYGVAECDTPRPHMPHVLPVAGVCDGVTE